VSAQSAVVGMALRHAAQLAHVQRFAQVHLHVPADLVRERHHVCASADLCYALDLDVPCFFLNLREIVFHLHAEPHFRA
jgi:hypothetical protein